MKEDRSLNVTLPDGKVLELPAGATTADVAAQIGAGLARVAIAGKITVDGKVEIVDLNRPLPGDCKLSILTEADDDSDSLYVLRHSTAHVMAEAICKLFPGTKLAYGPPLDDGFYYDLDVDRAITPEDFSRIEQEMKRIVQEDRKFCRYELPRGDAMRKLKDEGNRYKIDNAERAEGDSLSFYITGESRGKDFEDLCRGPHIPNTGRIKAFKVRQVSGAYYRGDVNDTPLTRVYGTAFFKKSSLTQHLERLEEAKRRDHRLIGKELELFTINEQVGSGLVLWLPKGAMVRAQLQEFLTGEMIKLGYDMVFTPHVGNLALYRCSGHYPYYEESQFPAMYESARGKALQSALQLARAADADRGPDHETKVNQVRGLLASIEQTWGSVEGIDVRAPVEQVVESLFSALAAEAGFLLKPMNCPHHIKIYAARPRSYRELPVRLAEYGTVYRFEQSGEISGLTRVRGFTQDDAHIFCTPEQLHEELATTVKLTQKVLDTLGLTDYRVRLGLRDPASDKYVGSAENWAKAEEAIRAVAKESGLPYCEEPGEAAFYGPKIDFVVKDCIGRSWQLGTVQADYNLPRRFELSYIGADNAAHTPIMVHRAPFGSMERFVGILIEHFAGAFPLWLSPVQVAVLTISEKSEDYARRVYQRLLEAGLRCELDLSSEKIGPKKHRARAAQINYILVVGEKEAQEDVVNVNDRNGKSRGNLPLEQFIAHCRAELAERRLDSAIGES